MTPTDQAREARRKLERKAEKAAHFYEWSGFYDGPHPYQQGYLAGLLEGLEMSAKEAEKTAHYDDAPESYSRQIVRAIRQLKGEG